MGSIKVVSFDLEGTLTKSDFTDLVWFEGIPALYAKRTGLAFEEAKSYVVKKYEEIGDRRREWYDINYWFDLFQLHDYIKLMDSYKHRVAYFPDVQPILSSLDGKYKLIVATNAANEFVPYLLNGIDKYFSRSFSCISELGQLKSPHFYKCICSEFGIMPEELVHVGDSWEFDVEAAREAGVKAFFLDRAQKDKRGGSLKSLIELKTKLAQAK